MRFVLLTVGLSALSVFTNPHTAHCQDAREALVLDVARVAVNESGFGSPADIVLIWQAVEASGRTAETRLSWLRRHSACPTGLTSDAVALSRPGNCRWSRHLTFACTEPPHWPADVRWSGEACARVFRLVRRLVYGYERRRVCEETPHTWGSLADHPGAVRRGLRLITCVGTRNRGYRVR